MGLPIKIRWWQRVQNVVGGALWLWDAWRAPADKPEPLEEPCPCTECRQLRARAKELGPP